MKRCYGCMKLKSNSPVCEHCGFNEHAQNKEAQLPVGTVLRDQYQVGRVLGQGGFGITYLGWDMNLEMPVAIKEYFPASLVSRDTGRTLMVTCTTGEVSFRNGRERFLKEVRTLAKLRDVPEVVHVHNFFKENDTAYIIMEYVEGMDLRQYVRLRGGKLHTQEMLAILRPLMLALEKVHEAGLVHRDISPDNIMVQQNGAVKLLDFGTARDVEGNTSMSTEAVLKHGFAPMEQYQRKGILGPWTDEYALCATVYYCLTGRVPPDAPERLMEQKTLDWTEVPALSPQQAQALEKGMSLRPGDRFATVQELYGELFPEESSGQTVTSALFQSACPVRKGETAPVTDYQPSGQYPSYTVPLETPEEGRRKAQDIYATAPLERGLGEGQGSEMTVPLQEAPTEPADPDGQAQGPNREWGRFEKKDVRRKRKGIMGVAAAGLAVIVGVMLCLVPDNRTNKDTWKQNMLHGMPVSCPYSQIPNQEIYGSDIKRREIRSITFLDSIRRAPKTAWDVSVGGDGRVKAWVDENQGLYDLYIAGNGGVSAPASADYLFCGYFNLQEINFNNNFHTDKAKTMVYMFEGCSRLRTLDLSGFDTTNVTNMNGMFASCRSIKNLDLSCFDTSRVTDTAGMFHLCDSLETLDISGFDTSKVTIMGSMFSGCERLRELDVSRFDTSSVNTNMNAMFADCRSLTSLNLTSFDTSHVKDVAYMLYNCAGLQNLELGNWEIDHVIDYENFMDPDAKYKGSPWKALFEKQTKRLSTYNLISSDTDETVHFNTTSGKRIEGMPWKLNTPVKNCTSITASLNVTELRAGNVKGDWGFYIHELNGDWKCVGTLCLEEVNQAVSKEFTFSTPVSFDKWAILCHTLGSYWDFNFSVWLSDAWVIQE